MTKRSTPQVVNTHWFGGVDKLPPNTFYIGRPSKYGNPFSSKSGKYTREESVAFHRVDLYRSLTTNPLFFSELKHDLCDKDLACWCKQPRRVLSCHGDNYLHVLSDRLVNRTYDKTIIHYLMDDLRSVMKSIEDWLRTSCPQEDFLSLYLNFGDVRLNIQYVLSLIKEKYVTIEDLCNFIAILTIELELAHCDSDLKMKEYWFYHVIWQILRFMMNKSDREYEPQSPKIPTTRIKKKIISQENNHE